MSRPDYQYLTNKTRSHLYNIMRIEIAEQGRFLVAVKRPKEKVTYGFTRERDKILNYIARRSLRDRNLLRQTKEILELGNSLMEHLGCEQIDSKAIHQKEKQLMIDYKGA